MLMLRILAKHCSHDYLFAITSNLPAGMGLSWHDVRDMVCLALIVRSTTFPVERYSIKVGYIVGHVSSHSLG